MKRSLVLSLPPREAYDERCFEGIVKKKLGLADLSDITIRIKRRSVDARSRKIKVNISLDVFADEPIPELISYQKDYPNVTSADPVIIVGMGPAGMFAALKLIENGIKPIIIERGKDVRSRRRDLAAINKEHIVNPNSNYCFGEGGAGTYSDGKLYTRSKKRGDVNRILEILVAHGAASDILFEAHPHIGTNKLPKVVAAMRESILTAGGEILFNTQVVDFIMGGDEINGVVTQEGEKITGAAVILATGHSSRDIYQLLDFRGIHIEAKPFALGVRVEHAQQLIDQIQYHCTQRGDYLPASSYALAHQVVEKDSGKRGVFSFCMCPGGFVVPAATAPGELVVNGMSPSRRDSRFANSGIVVAVNAIDFKAYEQHGPLAAMQFQKVVEQAAFKAGGNSQQAPAQRLVDFIDGRISGSLLETSYQPGLTSVKMHDVLPQFIARSLRTAFQAFGKKMKGYLTNEAQIIGVESRTSSPVTIPRDKDSCEHIQVKRLYPCGEGAGYAGGIVSAAMDGERCAEAFLQVYA
ncbi:FAD-dependent oxidoreductase [Fulvivirgaceae bacterium BMA12]|uniref:FAD-dependent oxidoreductase n=1 Tax=Agaribacillus aureus TaxID=3051825 RepID=A0ABT8L9Q1_9BACT|nr:FAD-dependent oxidoreductase [Fulvivirgaceae bacterium BMA12]